MPATAAHSPERLVTREGATVHRLPLERATPKQHVLAVTFRSSDDRSWHAVGGGETVAAAIEWARESCPDDTIWKAENWDDLYEEELARDLGIGLAVDDAVRSAAPAR